MVITEDQLELIEMFLSEVREGIENSTFEYQRKVLDLLSVSGKLAIENNEKVIYITCLLNPESQWLSLVQISHSSNLNWQNSVEVTARVILSVCLALDDKLLSDDHSE